MQESKPGFNTLALHAGQSVDPATGSRAVPIYQTSCYAFADTETAANAFALKTPANIYTRITNPTVDVLEKRIAAIDGGVGALAAASGMAAIFLAVTNLAGAGDHIVASASLYGGTDTLFRFTLKRFGIEVTFIEEITAEKVSAAIRPNTKLVYIEIIGNPKGDIPDLETIAAAAHGQGVPVIIDNTFAPGACRPFDFGIDIIVYSATKWLSGHGTSLCGLIVDSGHFDWKASGRFPELTTPDESYHGLVYTEAFGSAAYIVKARAQGLRNMGPCLSPFNAFEIIQGIETLPLRIKAHGKNTLKLALWLQKHPNVEWVNFTGLPEHPDHAKALKYLSNGYLGSVFGFGVKGGASAAAKFIDSVKLLSHVANVGDSKTLVINPWSTTHQQLSDEAKKACGITPGFIRVSVGLENIEDIIADFSQALA